jgi:hypothetical protein
MEPDDGTARCPHCGGSLEWEPRENDRTPVDDRFGRANELLREAAVQALRARVDELEAALIIAAKQAESAEAKCQAELSVARSETDSLRTECAKLKSMVRKLRSIPH